MSTRFFIALIPPQTVQNYADRVIQELGDRFQTRTAKAPPHVTLQPPFIWEIDAVSQLEEILQQFAQRRSSVPVRIDGFGAFAPRVLYLNVLKTAELLSLQAALREELEAKLDIRDPKTRQRGFSPHLTVASRNINKPIFQAAWRELQGRSVQFEFVGDRLILLIHDGQRWQIRSEFALTRS